MKNIFPVEYIITFWDEIDEKNRIRHGILFAENYSLAMKKIEKYYGDDIVDIKLFMNEENDLFELETCLESDYHGLIKIDGTIGEW